MPPSDWGAVAAEHRADQAAKRDVEAAVLAPLWANVPTARKTEILSADASSLLAAMQAGSATSEEIVLVYTERAYHIGCLEINAVTETFFLEAHAAAVACDAAVTTNPPPPLRVCGILSPLRRRDPR